MAGYYVVSMCTDLADFDVTTSWLRNQDYFQGVYCKPQTIAFCTICGVQCIQ